MPEPSNILTGVCSWATSEIVSSLSLNFLVRNTSFHVGNLSPVYNGSLGTKRQTWISDIKFLTVAGSGLFGNCYLNSNIGLGLSVPLPTKQHLNK